MNLLLLFVTYMAFNVLYLVYCVVVAKLVAEWWVKERCGRD